MHRQSGFTVVESLIVFVIAIIVGAFVFTIVTVTVDPNANYCDTYKYQPISDVPASCFDYLTEGKGAQR